MRTRVGLQIEPGLSYYKRATVKYGREPGNDEWFEPEWLKPVQTGVARDGATRFHTCIQALVELCLGSS